jgi:hypothetical protein
VQGPVPPPPPHRLTVRSGRVLPTGFRSSTSLRSVSGPGRVGPPYQGGRFRPLPVLGSLRSPALPLSRTAFNQPSHFARNANTDGERIPNRRVKQRARR